jgi:hypothetical protein
MAKRLAGKRLFRSMGQSDRSRQYPPKTQWTHKTWPRWAQIAYMRGYHDQATLTGEFAKFRKPFQPTR